MIGISQIMFFANIRLRKDSGHYATLNCEPGRYANVSIPAIRF